MRNLSLMRIGQDKEQFCVENIEMGEDKLN